MGGNSWVVEMEAWQDFCCRISSQEDKKSDAECGSRNLVTSPDLDVPASNLKYARPVLYFGTVQNC